jgi:hypothetical protein
LSGDRERVARLEQDMGWLKDSVNTITHKLDRKADKSEIRGWFVVLTVILTLTQILVYLRG